MVRAVRGSRKREDVVFVDDDGQDAEPSLTR